MFLKYLKLVLLSVIIITPFIINAETDPRTNYRSFIEVVPDTSTIPTVLEVPLPSDADYVLVYEPATNTYIDSSINKSVVYDDVTYSIFSNESTDGISGFEADLLDDNFETSIDLLVKQANTISKSDFYINSSKVVDVSSLDIVYGTDSALPREVSLYVITPNGEELMAVRTGYEVRNIKFPLQFGQSWRLAFVYDEPIRISDIKFGPADFKTVVDKVIFLAQPNLNYLVYLYPQNLTYVPLRSSGNLSQAESFPPASVSSIMVNPQYIKLDQDQDKVPDEIDNCPQHPNPDQISSRNSLKGDVCDDFDNDGVINISDNCQFLPNSNQKDEDSDGIGNECDSSESRLTEKYPWLPWIGMGITLVVLLILFVTVARHPIPAKEVDQDQV